MSEQNVEIVRGLYERFASGELGVAVEFYDPEIELSRIGGGLGGDGRWRGLEEVRAGNVEFLKVFDEYRMEAERIMDLGDDRVLVLSRHIARGTGSGVPIEHELGDMVTLRNGKILRLDYYWDRAEALKAAGLSG